MPRIHFKGKVFVENHHLAVPFHELLPVREKGLSDKARLHDNLVVHGDNLPGYLNRKIDKGRVFCYKCCDINNLQSRRDTTL